MGAVPFQKKIASFGVFFLFSSFLLFFLDEVVDFT
jgi:hypothetical protein